MKLDHFKFTSKLHINEQESHLTIEAQLASNA